MSQILRRYYAHAEHLDSQRKVGRILIEKGDPAPTTTRSTAGGDERKLRGIPAIGRGVRGSVHGGVPHIDGIRRI